jgi:uncharacterized surface protein with fasciclin (FAS1) repeats
MKKSLLTTLVFGAFCTTFATPALANNVAVESALANYGDLSSFYAALLNTGVLGELSENAHYTVLAPTNEAFAEINPQLYPCFYAVQCRAQLADALRDHIIVGRWTLKELAHQPQVNTLGRYAAITEQPYVNEYTVSGQHVLTSAQINGNVIDRLDGVIISQQQLDQFHALPPVANATTTITTYRTPVAYPAPGGGYDQGLMTKTVTEKTYDLPPAGTVTYPDGTQVTTTRRAYVTPNGLPAGVDETTTTTQTY